MAMAGARTQRRRSISGGSSSGMGSGMGGGMGGGGARASMVQQNHRPPVPVDLLLELLLAAWYR
jgi:hypothetical protein